MRSMTAGLLGIVLACAALPAHAQDAKDIVLSDKDNGARVTLSGKQRLVIMLPTTAGTGYGWSALMTPDSVLAFTDNPAAPAPAAAAPMVGRPAQTVLSFRPARYTESYSASFTLIYCRAPCDPADRATKTFRIGVTTTKG